MRAIRFHKTGAPDVLVLEEVPDPIPARGEVRVAVRAIGVNFADTHFRKGEYFVKPQLPDVPGMEAAGVIDAVGEGVIDRAVGDRVAILGARAYAERVVAPARATYRMPEGLSFEDAAALPVQGLTAVLALERSARFERGESVLVHAAAGGVGSLAVQIAKLRGAKVVIGATGSESKLSVIRELGADAAVSGDFVQSVKAAAPGGVDVIFEMTGGSESYKRNLACLAPEGRMIVFGAASGDMRGTIEPIGLMGKNLTITGFYLTPYVAKAPEVCAAAFAELAADVASKKIRVLRDRALGLADAAEAHRLLESRKAIGKLVLTT